MVEIIVGIIAGLIGVVGIVIGVVANSRVERLKYSLEKKNYISKARFDKEFEIYDKICEALVPAVDACCDLFLEEGSVPKNADDRRNLQNEAKNIHEKLFRMVLSKAPFISEDLYNDFVSIGGLCDSRLDMPFDRDPPKNDHEKIRMDREDHNMMKKRNDEIFEKCDAIFKKMRKYLKSLETKE